MNAIPAACRKSYHTRQQQNTTASGSHRICSTLRMTPCLQLVSPLDNADDAAHVRHMTVMACFTHFLSVPASGLSTVSCYCCCPALQMKPTTSATAQRATSASPTCRTWMPTSQLCDSCPQPRICLWIATTLATPWHTCSACTAVACQAASAGITLLS
jgi:hypothetical protein